MRPIECDGSPYCQAEVHLHGCFAERKGQVVRKTVEGIPLEAMTPAPKAFCPYCDGPDGLHASWCDGKPPIRMWDEFPFPLSSGELAEIRIPRGELTQEDSDRFAEFVRTLAVD